MIFLYLRCAPAPKRHTYTVQGEHQQHTQVENYFSALLAHNLLAKAQDIDRPNIYRTTEKGMRFIECCDEIRSLIGLVINSHRIDPMSDFYAFDRQP